MARIYNQALAHRFGVALIDCLEGDEWETFEAAVAWVRRSGMRHLLPALRRFLERGKTIQFIVGVDIENTSMEGLEDMLSLSDSGNCTTFVHHNESTAVFHPKMYLFTNSEKGRLIIGSSNITEAGLYVNTEVSLQIDAGFRSQVIVDAQTALRSWSDTSERLALKLDRELLTHLVTSGYVLEERALRSRRRDSESARARSRGGASAKVLFGKRTVSAPIPPEGDRDSGGSRSSRGAAASGPRDARVSGQLAVRGYDHAVTITNVLLMKVRPARGTQVQIPIPLRQSAFFDGQDAVTSGHDGARRPISATHPERAGGSVNTYKVEIPETNGIAVPVVRLDRSNQGIVYYAYDASSVQGRPILDSLETGRHKSPADTILTKPNDPEHSTWYRFI